VAPSRRLRRRQAEDGRAASDPARGEWHQNKFPSASFLPAHFYFAQAPGPFLQFASLRWVFPGACVLRMALSSDLRWIFAMPLYLFSSAALLVS
jgi:hypothetical protein